MDRAMPSETWVRVDCHDCGAVRVTFQNVRLRVCADNDRWSYSFRCPQCDRATARDISQTSALDLLLAIGTPTEIWQLPAELTEPHPTVEPLTPDDLLDFHLFLLDADPVAEALASDQAGPVT
jgi:hypothetical protein